MGKGVCVTQSSSFSYLRTPCSTKVNFSALPDKLLRPAAGSLHTLFLSFFYALYLLIQSSRNGGGGGGGGGGIINYLPAADQSRSPFAFATSHAFPLSIFDANTNNYSFVIRSKI
jgi:hypothetical protein